MAGPSGHVKLIIAPCFLWAIILSPCAAQGAVCSNEATIVVNTNNATLLTYQDAAFQTPDNCIIWEISPSPTTGLVAVEILEIFDSPPDVQVLAILYPSSQNRLFNNALISSGNARPLFYVPADDSPALELKIITSGGSATYGFVARVSLVNETEWCGESSYNLEVGQTATINNPDYGLGYICSWQFHGPPSGRLLVRFTDYVVPRVVIFITSLKLTNGFEGYAPSGNEDLYIFNFLTANASVPRVQTVVDSTVHVFLLNSEFGNYFPNEYLRFHLEVSAFDETALITSSIQLSSATFSRTTSYMHLRDTSPLSSPSISQTQTVQYSRSSYSHSSTPISCGSDEFLCDTGIQCVSNNTRCDGLPDCDDHSDELGCNGCDFHQFSCVTNSIETCHSSKRLCDSNRHCDNFQDEYGCVPSCEDFKISLTSNTTHRVSSPYAPNDYPTNVVCAWLISSPPGTRLVVKAVQINLDYHATLTVGEGAQVDPSRILWRRQGGTAPLTTSSVGHDVWVTLEDVYPTLLINNDGDYRSVKNTHFIIDVSVLTEAHCVGEDQVTCDDGYQCISASDLCDGVIHCSDYSDELSCGHCGDTSLPCDVYSASSPCVDKTDMCNGRADCTNYTDESLCLNICGSKRHIYLEERPFDVTSPPNGLPPLVDCFWIFTTSPEHRILVRNSNGMPRLKVDEGAFEGLDYLSVLYVDDHRLCCFFPATIECKTLEPEPPLFVCSELMPNLVLKVSMWILGVSALIGNMFVMIWRFREDTDGRDSRIVQSLFVFNLAISDSLMGMYMLIIAGADLHFGNRYFEVSSEWQASVLCKVAGFLSIVASEASVFFLTVISIARFLCIVFPFSSYHIRAKSGRFIACSIWISAITVGLVPTILALDSTSDVYGISDVCIGLPLMTKVTSYETRQQTIDAGGLTTIRVGIPSPVGYRASWFFSIALFLGVNLFCFLMILVCYICIFASARSSMKQVRRHKNQDDELRMAIKMAAIVMTDFICWIPVIIMGILSQSRVVEIPPETYAWVVVFILPINSSLNPYLYTISDLCSQRKRSSSKKKSIFSRNNLKTNRNTPVTNVAGQI